MRSILTALLLATSLSAPALAQVPTRTTARPMDEQRYALVWTLESPTMRLTRSTLDAIGPRVEELLYELAMGPNKSSRVRIRALAGLGFYPNPRSLEIFRSLLYERGFADAQLGLSLRRQAIRSMGFAFKETVAEELLALRYDVEPLVREAAALAIADTEARLAIPTLETWLSVEPVLQVRVAVDKALTRLRGL